MDKNKIDKIESTILKALGSLGAIFLCGLIVISTFNGLHITKNDYYTNGTSSAIVVSSGLPSSDILEKSSSINELSSAIVATNSQDVNSQATNSQDVKSQTANNKKINVNTATKKELETLNGIGEVLAQRIIDLREQRGKYSNIEDLLMVKGIGEKTLNKFKDSITVN